MQIYLTKQNKSGALKIMLFLCLIISLACVFVGCAEKVDLPYSVMERDAGKTGGENLTFSYNAHEHILTVGGDGEKIEFYTANSSIGRNIAGNYIGVKIAAPEGVRDFKEAKLEFNGKTTQNGEFLVGKDFTIVYPKVTEKERDFEIKITWQKNAKPQTYKVHIAEGTKLEKFNA